MDNEKRDKPKVVVIDRYFDIVRDVSELFEGRYEMVGFTSCEDALEYLRKEKVSVVILDEALDDIKTFKFYGMIKGISENIKVIYHTTFPENNFVFGYLARKANGVVLKGEISKLEDMLKKLVVSKDE